MLQAEDKEFMEWEDKMAIKRSQGHFFQSLYRIKRQLPDGGKPGSPPAQVGLTQYSGRLTRLNRWPQSQAQHWLVRAWAAFPAVHW